MYDRCRIVRWHIREYDRIDFTCIFTNSRRGLYTINSIFKYLIYNSYMEPFRCGLHKSYCLITAPSPDDCRESALHQAMDELVPGIIRVVNYQHVYVPHAACSYSFRGSTISKVVPINRTLFLTRIAPPARSKKVSYL